MQQQTDAESQRAHITLKAVTTVGADEGVFEAVISTESVDREKDIVAVNAMVKALTKWGDIGKLIPLAWMHSSAAEDQIGHVKPDSVKAVAGEVVAAGWIDQSTDRGQHAWRLVKSGTLGFSFGYLTLAATKRKGGGNHITELDVFEVSATPTPINGDTRVLGWKSDDAPAFALDTELQEVKARLDTLEKALEDQKKTVEETAKETKSRAVDPLRQQADALALEVASDGMNLRPLPERPEPAPEPELIELKDLRERSRDLMLQVLSGMEP